MKDMENSIVKRLSTYAEQYKEIRLFLLFGSRSQGIAREESDWDFGYIADVGFDPLPLYTDLVLALETDKVDLVDLSRASGLLRFRAVRDGIVLFEKPKGQYQKLWLDAVHFWCDASPVIRQEYDAVLEGLG
jgi:predicted nucleotidyltransferase